MSAYLIFGISGNTNFGGYISIDGEKSVPIIDDDFIKLSPGQHSLQIHSTSDAERKMGKTQAFLYNNTSSSGAILDSLERGAAKSALGDTWDINVYVEDGQAIFLSVLTKGQIIIDDPLYKIEVMSEEMQKDLDEKFDAWLNTPVRSKKLIGWGIGLAFAGIFGLSNYLSQGGIETDGVGGLVLFIGMAALGGWLFYSGFKKKIRRK